MVLLINHCNFGGGVGSIDFCFAINSAPKENESLVGCCFPAINSVNGDGIYLVAKELKGPSNYFY